MNKRTESRTRRILPNGKPIYRRMGFLKFADWDKMSLHHIIHETGDHPMRFVGVKLFGVWLGVICARRR